MIPADFLTLRLTLSRKVAHDCPDLIGVPVLCRLPVTGRVDPEFLDAVVEEDVTNDDGVVIYSQDETLRWQSHSQLNLDQLREACELFCQERDNERLIYLQREDDFDQRPQLGRAA